jgi:hypothetical protein
MGSYCEERYFARHGVRQAAYAAQSALPLHAADPLAVGLQVGRAVFMHPVHAAP